MASEKRLIDANRTRYELNVLYCDSRGEIREGVDDAIHIVNLMPTVDAVEANKYEELVGMYHDLRESFVDYVCSGIRNEAPYCLNRCEDCVDKRGWCKLERCQGFNPAEVILYRCAKMDGDGNGNL